MLRHLLSATLITIMPLAALPAAAQRSDGPPRDYDRREQRPNNYDRRYDNRAEARGWSEPVIIASERVNSREERVVFRLPKNEGRLSELSIRTGGDSILLNAIDITYADGRMQRVDIVDRLLPGEQSRPIVLEPQSPPVREVVVWKRPSWRPTEGTLQLIGVPRQPPRAAVADLEVIDRQIVDAREERISFRVSPRAPALDAIQFRTLDDRMLISHVDVDFADGRRQRYELLERLMPGQSTRFVEFDRPQRVQSVVLWKRPSWRPGRTAVELLGNTARRAPEPPKWGGIGQDIPRGWVLFGTQDVSFKTDRDVIRVGREIGRFDRIALRVHDNDVFLREFTVVYANGERDRRLVETTIPAGRQTRPIDLDGKRFIKEIELIYRSRPGGDTRATVEVYGEFARDWFSDRGGWRQHNSGWAMLGAQRASMFQKDKDAVNVGERFGRIKALRLAARRTDVRLYSVKIIYANGESEELRLVSTLRSGETTPIYEIKGRGRFIDRVVLKYRSRLDVKGSGIIEVWGLS